MGPNQLLFSIVVPTYDRPARLAACLQALARLIYPRDRFEVIVVDDGGQTPLGAVVAPFCNQLDLTLLVQPHAGPATARNTGAARAKGEFLAFTDDDCAPAPDWLQTLAACFTTTPACAVGGRTLNALPDNLYSTASQLLIDYLYAYYNTDPNRARFFTSNNLALPAARFHAIGRFDPTFPWAAGEDRELCDRWLHGGYRMIYAPQVRVYHTHGLTLRSFWRQHLYYGRGASCFHQVRAQRGQERLRLEPLAFYRDLLRHPFSPAWGRRAPVLAALLAMAQVANAAGFLWERANRTNGHQPSYRSPGGNESKRTVAQEQENEK